MGRFDPVYTPEQKAELCRLVRQEGWSIKQAAEKHGMPYESARKFVQQDYLANPTELGDNPIGEMADRLTGLVNRELSQLESVANPNNKLKLDLDRAQKLAKLLLDLAKLRKENAPPAPEKPESPLANLKAA